jgi:hypothetical protein
MPILYIHGVATRNRDGFCEIKPYLQRLVAPVISPEPDGVLIEDVFWGDVAATFAWDGASRPKSRLLGMGAGAVSASPSRARSLRQRLPRRSSGCRQHLRQGLLLGG